MAYLKHSTPRVSAYSMYTRNKKSDDSEEKTINAKPVIEAKINYSDMDSETHSLRKRKITTNKVNGTVPEEQVKKKRGRKKKIVQEETPVTEALQSDSEQELEAEKNENGNSHNDVNINFGPSTSKDTVSSKNQTAPCGNEAAEEFFRWTLSPYKVGAFFENHWEKKPLFIKRPSSEYYEGLFSVKEFENIVKENHLCCDQEIDIVAYVDDERKPLIKDKRILPSFLWAAFKEGYSIRMRNPQVYNNNLGRVCTLMQEYFSSFVGCNMYLTPADTQGFPPHYDDIDAFILQIEGKKIWKIYQPKGDQVLARFSSADMTMDEIGEPCMEVELNPGDLLYFPRGFIHQAKAASGMHSLHLTLSTNQLNTWGDLLHTAVNQAIEDAMQNDVEFRKSLPKDYMNYMGYVHTENDSKERQDFMKKGMNLIRKSLDYVSLDYAADTQAVNFIHGSMPPVFTSDEKKCSVHGNGAQLIGGKAFVPEELNLKTKIRLIRKRAFTLDVEADGARLFHTLSNSKNHKEKEAVCVEVDIDCVPALTRLFKLHPDYVRICNLPHENPQVLLACLQQLYESGFLMTEQPLPFEEE